MTVRQEGTVNKAIHNRLVRLAKSRQTTSYGDIAPLAGLDTRKVADRSKIARILEEISVYEHSRARPMLSAIVLYTESSSPGQGFFELARSLDRYSGTDEHSERQFLSSEIASVWAQWK
jgi:hypothetical protein